VRNSRRKFVFCTANFAGSEKPEQHESTMQQKCGRETLLVRVVAADG